MLSNWCVYWLLTLDITANCARASRMVNQTPMSWQRWATGRRVSHTNLCASNRISIQLLSSAKSGASGKAATKMVMKPNWRTWKLCKNLKFKFRLKTSCIGWNAFHWNSIYPFRGTLQKAPHFLWARNLLPILAFCQCFCSLRSSIGEWGFSLSCRQSGLWLLWIILTNR